MKSALQWSSGWLKRISKPVRIAFSAAFVIGFITHIVAISGLFVNHDVLTLRFSLLPRLVMLQQGKPFFWFAKSLLNTTYSGSIDGVVALLMIALTAGFTVAVLEIRSNICAGLIGALLATFPSVMCTFAYSGEWIFFAAIMLSSMSVWLAVTCRRGFLPGALCLAVAIGIYPPVIGFAAGMYVILCLCRCLTDRDATIRDILRMGVRFILILAAACAVYYCILQIMLRAFSTTLGSYRNVDKMLNPDWSLVPKVLRYTYEHVLRFFWFDYIGTGGLRFVWLYRLTVLGILLFSVLLTLRTDAARKWNRCLLSALLLLLFPYAIHAVGILSQMAFSHWIMIYSFVLMFVLLLKLADMSAIPGSKQSRTLFCTQLASVAIAIGLLCNWFTLTNTGYLRMRTAYEGFYASCQLMIERITETPEFAPDTKVAIIGSEPFVDSDFPLSGAFVGIVTRTFLSEEERGHYQIMLHDYFEADYLQFVDWDTEDALRETEAFKNMACFPYPGCTQMIDGVLVLKLSDVPAE